MMFFFFKPRNVPGVPSKSHWLSVSTSPKLLRLYDFVVPDGAEARNVFRVIFFYLENRVHWIFGPPNFLQFLSAVGHFFVFLLFCLRVSFFCTLGGVPLVSRMHEDVQQSA